MDVTQPALVELLGRLVPIHHVRAVIRQWDSVSLVGRESLGSSETLG